MEEKDINKLVDEALSSIDNIKRARAEHLSNENILSEMFNRKVKKVEFTINFLYKAAAVFILLLSLNMFTWAHLAKQKSNYKKEYYNYSVHSIADYYFNK